jgi:transposase-like protein
VEDVLIKSSIFKLPGKKKLLESEAEPKVIVIDVTESSNAPGRRIRPAALTTIERPKKNRKNTIQEKKETIP